MTSSLATNAVVPNNITTPYFLKSTKDGVPINRQVPRTYQVYAGTGNQTIDYDGSNEIIINGTFLTGPLIINFGPIKALRNWLGRKVNIVIAAPISQTITLNTSPAFMKINGTGLTELSHVIPADNMSKAVSIYFHSTSLINVDYGSSSSSIVPLPVSTGQNVGGGIGIYRDNTGSVLNFRTLIGDYYTSILQNPDDLLISDIKPYTYPVTVNYPYMVSGVFCTVPAFYSNDNYQYNVSFNTLDPLTEGTITSLSPSSVSGIGPQVISFVYSPPPRITRPVTGYLVFRSDDFSEIEYMAPIIFTPNLSNVDNSQFFMGVDPVVGKQIRMYDVAVNPGATPRNATDPNGITYTGSPTIRLSFNIQDNYFIFANTAIGRIQATSVSDGMTSTIIDVVGKASWSAGATIVDVDYCEMNSTIYVLPSGTTNRLLLVPVMKYFPLSGVVGTSVVTYINLNLPASSTPLSIAVCPLTRYFYIAVRPAAGNIQIFMHNPVGTQLVIFSTIFANASNVSMVVGSRGNLIVHSSSNNGIYTLPFGSTFSDALVLQYTLPAFYNSLARSGYGFQSV